MKKVASKVLLAAVPAILIYWATVGLPKFLRVGKEPVPSTDVVRYNVEGQVVDRSNQRLLSGARVTLEITDKATPQTTDSVGRYSFSLPPLASDTPEPITAALKAEAFGYTAFQRNLAADEAGKLQPAQLMVELTPAPGSLPTAPIVKATDAVRSVEYIRREHAASVAVPESLMRRLKQK